MNTIGYDFEDFYIDCGNIEVAIRLSTEGNIYSPSDKHLKIVEKANCIEISSTQLSSAGGQILSEGKLTMEIQRSSNNRMTIKANGKHPSEKCKSIVILIKGINAKAFVSDSENMKKSSFKERRGIEPIMYPGRSATMPLIFIETNQEEWFILSKDTKVRKKSFSAYYDVLIENPIISISHEEDRRQWRNSIDLPEWQIGIVDNRIDIVKERCKDLEEKFKLTPFKDKKNFEWINDIKMTVNFHGEHWTGHVFSTFYQMITQLEWICQKIDGKQLLVFLPAWDGRYYYTYPKHQPSERMGGAKGLKAFVKRAHGLGVKVVPMLGGPNLATFEFLKDHNMLDAALKNEWGYPLLQDWLDWNNDHSIECQGFITNFGHPEYRKYMIESSSYLIKEFDVDGIFLDGAIRWTNDPDYSPYEGMVEYVKEMREKHPDKLLMAEDGYDVLWGLFELFASSWGPIGQQNAMLKYTRQTEYLAYPAENGSSGIHEVAWRWKDIDRAIKKYTIPTISLWEGIIDEYSDQLEDKIFLNKQWKLGNAEILN